MNHAHSLAALDEAIRQIDLDIPQLASPLKIQEPCRSHDKKLSVEVSSALVTFFFGTALYIHPAAQSNLASTKSEYAVVLIMH